MSKEFEEIVLKKLEKLETLDKRTQKTDQLIEEVVLKKLEVLETEVKNNNQRLGVLETEAKNTQAGLNNMEQRICKLETEVKNTQEGLNNLSVNVEQRLGKLEMEVKDTGEVVNYLNQNFTKFDYEINKKIDTLFDAYSVNQQKDNVHEENIVSLNTKVFNHDIRISNLENTVLTA